MKKNQKISILVIILLFFVSIANLSCQYFQTSDVNKSDSAQPLFVPNQEVKDLAVGMDKKYFPVFLDILDQMKMDNYEFINENFDTASIIFSTNKGNLISIDTINTNVSLFYSRTANTTRQALSNHDRYKVEIPVDWEADPYNDRSWQLFFRSLHWLRYYLDSQDKDTILACYQVIQDFLMNNLEYPPKYGKFIYDDMAVGFRLSVMIKAFERYQSSTINDNKFFQQLLGGIVSHIAFMSSLEKYSWWHNHGIYIDMSLMKSLHKIEGLTIRDEITNLACQRCAEQFFYCFADDGTHKEHTPCYHIDMTRKLGEFISYIEDHQMNIDRFDKLQSIYADANEFTQYLFRPNGRIPPIGDCHSKIMNADLKLPAYTISPFKIFPEGNWAFFNSGKDSQINAIIQADFFSFAHYQEDETSFILTVANQELIIDPGLHSYNNSSPLDDYMRKARAHNVLIVNGTDFDFNLSNTGLSGITRYCLNETPTQNWTAIVEMTHAHYKQRFNVEIYRQFGQINDSCFVIRDIVKSDEEHLYSQIFHFAPDAIIHSEDHQNFIISWPGYEYRIWLTSNTESFEVVEGEMNPTQGWYFPRLLEARPQPVLIIHKNGRSEEIITYLTILNGNQLPDKNQIEAKAICMFTALDSLSRKVLVRQPVPEKWKPNRGELF
jgi:hypothetical protein